MNVFTLQADLTLDSSRFSSGLASIEGELNGNETLSRFAAWGTTIGNLAADAFKMALRGIKDFAVDSIKTGMDFDAAMAEVRAKRIDMTEKEFTSLRDYAQELGRTTRYTAEESANAFMYMAQGGLSVDEMLGSVDATLQLAAASNMSLADATQIVIKTMKAFSTELSNDNVQHFVDVLASTATNSTTDIYQLGESFKYMASQAGTLGYSIEDVAAGLGIMANNGINASMAGTAMRKILSSLINPTDKAAAAMKEFNLSLTDSETGRIKSFREVMNDMRRAYTDSGFDPAGRTLNEVIAKETEIGLLREENNNLLFRGQITEKEWQKTETDLNHQLADFVGVNEKFIASMSDFAGVRGISALLAIMKSTDEDFNQLMNAVDESEGAGAEMMARQLDSLKGDVTILNSAIDGLKIVLSDKFNNNLRDLAQLSTRWITDLANTLQYGFGDEIDRTERKEQQVITEAEKKANEAQGIVAYMDGLIAQFGDAADKTNEWNDALERLKILMPEVGEALGGSSAKENVENLKEYIELQRQQAILEAKRKSIGAYQKAAEEAQTALFSAQVGIDVAEQTKKYAADQIIDIMRRAVGDAWNGEAEESAWRSILEQRGANGLAADLYYRGEDYLGMTHTELQALVESYNEASAAQQANTADIEALQAAYDKANAALALAESSYASLVSGMDGTTASATTATEAISGVGDAIDALPDSKTITIDVVTNGGLGVLDTDGSFAVGAPYIPFNNYRAILHRGEEVLTAQQARERRSGVDNSNSTAMIAAALRSAVMDLTMELNSETVGRVFGDTTSRRVNRNIVQINRRQQYGYGG